MKYHTVILFILLLPTKAFSQSSCISKLNVIIDNYQLRGIDQRYNTLVKKYPLIEERLTSFIEHSKLQETESKPKIDSIFKLPLWLSNDFRDIDEDLMIDRFEMLSPKIQSSILSVYNTLSDKIYLSQYISKLYKEAAVNMFEYPQKTYLKTKKFDGTIDARSFTNVLIQRMKQKKDSRFTKLRKDSLAGKVKKNIITNSLNDIFRLAVSSGPFIDSYFNSFKAHGAYSHLIQRDIVHETLVKIWGKDYNDFYIFLSTKKGIHWWIDLFDSGQVLENSFTNPETVSKNIMFLRTGTTPLDE